PTSCKAFSSTLLRSSISEYEYEFEFSYYIQTTCPYSHRRCHGNNVKRCSFLLVYLFICHGRKTKATVDNWQGSREFLQSKSKDSVAMNRKRSKDDEIPLTVTKSSILQETKERFDTLLKAALSQEDGIQKKSGKVGRKSLKGDFLKDVKPHKRRSKKKLSTSTQKLVTEDDHSTSSELDWPDNQNENSVNTSLEEVKDFTPISSSDEHNIPENSEDGNPPKTKVLIHSHSSLTERANSTPKKRDTFSITPSRDESRESRETTSSRVSSPDSVMTAIEAASPSKTIQLTLSGTSSPRGNNVEEYELKPLKGLSASYEEIDETSLDKTDDRFNQNSARGMNNAASYEEILEDPKSHQEKVESESNLGLSDRHTRSKKLKKNKPQLPPHKPRRREDGSTDTSSNDLIPTDSRHKKRRVAHTQKRSKSIVNDSENSQAVVQYTYEKIIGITIHRCDTLKIDSLIQHPMVRVHILDTKTGEYLKKSQSGRNVSYYQEGPRIDYIQPLTCQPCTFKDPRSLTPIWEETLLFNEDIKHILQPQASILILFEVLDCVSVDVAISKYEKLGTESGWHRIAWAFLKPRGANDILNIDKKLRLQLYKPRSEKTIRNNQNACDKCDVYRWWSKGGWIHYPSTLHITVHSLPLPSDVTPALRSYFALQPEQISESTNVSDDDEDAENTGTSRRIASSHRNSSRSLKDEVVWSRLPLQSCKIPNEKFLDLPSGLNGSFSIKYSHHGLYLAVTGTIHNIHSIHVYRVLDGTEVVRFQGHPGLIYSLDWSLNDQLLLSASADCTACVWSVKSKKISPMQMLPHPSFVYCAVFLSTKPLSLATGCCDQIIRIWRENSELSTFELKQEINGHEGYVSTLCVNSNGNLFSGDSNGQIRIWQYNTEGILSEIRVLTVRELKGVILNHLILHPGGKRMLVLARDSLLRMIDIGTGVAIQWFKGALNHRIHSKACITPCGGLVFSPSEDGSFYVWNADTGQLMTSYSAIFQATHHAISLRNSGHKPESSTFILSGAVDYHPFDHIAAFSVYGIHAPVAICKYNRESSGKDVGLQGQQEVDRHVPIDTFAKSAQIVAKVKRTQTKLTEASKKDLIPSGGASIFESNPECEDEGLKKNQHLSYIIKQLDYVLHLGRLSKQEQLDKLARKQSDPSSPGTSIDSLRAGSSPTAPITHVEKYSKHKSKADTEIAYSVPHSNVTERVQDNSPINVSLVGEMPSMQNSRKANFSSTVELHYVEEKQPPRPMPRQRKLKSLRQNGKQLPAADLSTTDTSILSSESEDTKTVTTTVPAQLFNVNEVKDAPNLNSKLETNNRVRVEHYNPAFSSFDSDSETRVGKVNDFMV
ncbi:Jouberin, partial [Frankliniella fusca]